MRFGARHLKRAIERYLVFPLSNLLATRQIQLGDLISVDYDWRAKKLVFLKEEHGALVGSADEAAAETAMVSVSSGHAVGAQALARRAPATDEQPPPLSTQRRLRAKDPPS